MKKYAQENYFNNLDTLIGNQDSRYANKNFLQVIGRFMGKKSKLGKIPPLNKGNNSYAYINSENANVLNDFFSSVSTIDDNEVPLPHFEKRTQSIPSEIKINNSEFIDILKTLKVNKATGPDGISHRLLKIMLQL